MSNFYGITNSFSSYEKQSNKLVHKYIFIMKTTVKTIIHKWVQLKKHALYGFFTLTMLIVFAFSSIGNRYQFTTITEFLKILQEKFAGFHNLFPEDKVYVQLDKPFYKPGETIWYSAYVRNAQDMKPSAQSDIVYVEFISPKGNVITTQKIIVKNGKAIGDFQTDENYAGGIYKVKAYTNWQKNDPNGFIFEKEIQIQQVILPNIKMKLDFERKAFGAGDKVLAKLELNSNENKPLANTTITISAKLDGQQFITKKSSTDEDGISYISFDLPKSLSTNDGLLNILIDYQGQTESISRSIPIVLNTLKFELFPEGGDMVANLNNKVAFRALNEFGKPADVEGIIVDNSGKKVASFSSFHMGMGAFDFIPEDDKKYTARITKPEGIKTEYELPEVYNRGFILSCNNADKEKLQITISSSEKEQISLVAQVRGKIYYANAVNVVVGKNLVEIPLTDFPIGVAQITLFDAKNIERAERLVFVNKNKQLNISIQTDKEKYLPREKVKMTVSIKDERGMPMPANISLSVVNDNLLSFADDKSGNILSKLFLESDIKDKVEEPAFYFDPKMEKADKALDYLLLTAGWRRFAWEKILSMQIPNISFIQEHTVIQGIVLDENTSNPIPNAKVTVENKGISTLTDKNGKFAIKNIDLSEPTTIRIIAPKFEDYVYQVNNYFEQTLYMYDKNRMVYMIVEEDMAPNAVKGGNVIIDEMMELNVDQEQEIVKEKNNKVINENKKGNNKPNDINKAKDNPQEGQDVATGEINGGLVNDDRADLLLANTKVVVNENGLEFYRARQFAAPVYKANEKVEVRTDFRSTIYWNGNLEIDRKGKATIEFFNSDEITSFRATAEGISADGSVGRFEKVYFTQLPFAMSVKLPIEVATEDILEIPLTLKNTTASNVTGKLKISAPEGLLAMNTIPDEQSIAAQNSKLIYLKYRVLDKTGKQNFKISFESDGLSDAFEQELKIVAKGFPVTASFSGNEMEKEYSIRMEKVISGSLSANLTAYPSVVSDILKGIEAILSEPYGCFEQTSMTSYPNVMVMNYLKTTDNPDEKLLAKATNLLDKGYKRLLTFETAEKGYEWFGGAPGHEALSAYGLMQFNDMKAIYKVDQTMIDRTANWLMEKRDGNGGFKRNARALDNFGGASDEITNAYIVYALAEAGYRNINKELDLAYNKAKETKDPYQLGLLANALYSYHDKSRAEICMNLLYEKQAIDGSFTGLTHSITRSTGISLTVETSSLAIMAMIKSGNPRQPVLDNSVKYLIGSRSGGGYFGSTQGTIMALKALTEYAQYAKKTNESGTIEFYVDGKKVAEKSYLAGQREPIELKDLEKFLKTGKTDLKIKYVGCKNPLPYSLLVKWNTFLPNSSEKCVIDFTCNLDKSSVKTGETVRLTVNLKNKTNDGQPMTVAIIGIPAGLTAQPWQLKELQEKKIVDYYETLGNNIVIYYRQMAPSEIKKINFDLKAEIPGEYDAPASSAYLYYTNEFKTWVGLPRFSVEK